MIIDNLLANLVDGEIRDVVIGINWTAVVVDTGTDIRCGLASTIFNSLSHTHGKIPRVPLAGDFAGKSAKEIAQYAVNGDGVSMSIGMAAINALLDRDPSQWNERNAAEVLERVGEGKRVAMIGHFPFVPELRHKVGDLVVLDQNPKDGDLPAEAAPDVLPTADVVAITGMTLLNRSYDHLINLVKDNAFVLVMGPTTPLSPIMFDEGASMIAGAIVEDIPGVLRVVSQGGNFRQVHRAGTKLVTIDNPALKFDLRK